MPARPQTELQQTVSEAPTLILAGELDALTPPSWSYEAARGLERSGVIILPAGFHTETTNWDGDGCALSLAARFFSSSGEMLGETGPPACVEARSAPEFELR